MTELTTVAAPKGAQDALEELVRKMYISNVSKRLRELNQPTETDKKRWVWELIQNAKDTIASDPIRNFINVRIDIDGDKVTFIHDGNPFTLNARFGLLWKYSEAKENQESTGRFGTGFLTTHCLSKVVTIESDVYEDKDSDNLLGFRVTMFRDGDTESELLEGLDKMRESEQYFKQTFGHTSFTYHIKSDSGREAVRLGLENFFSNITQTMLFCPELNSVILNNNGSITKIRRGKAVEISDSIRNISIEIESENNKTRNFLVSSIIKDSAELSARYKHPRKLRLQTAIEIDEDRQIVSHDNSCGFYCVLPLVGIESQLNEPLYVNCPDFEPDSERQSLLLNGQTRNEESGLITEVGINHMIYNDILDLYDQMLKYVVENNISKVYRMAEGLKSPKTHDKLDKEWYKNTVLKGYRDSLLSIPIAHTVNGPIALEDAIIIREDNETHEKTLYELVSKIYPNAMLVDNHEWASVIWKDERVKVWDLEDFCKHISEKYSNWSEIPASEEVKIEDWYNQFLEVIKARKESLLSEYPLLPDRAGNLHTKDDGLRQNINVTDQVIQILTQLGKNKSGDLLHPAIRAISLDKEYNSQSAAAEINQQVTEIVKSNGWLDKVMPLLAALPTNPEKFPNDPDYCHKRKVILSIANSLFGKDVAAVEDNCLIHDSWRVVDQHFVNAVLVKLNELKKLSSLPNGLDAKWLSDILKVIKPTQAQWENYAVLPNQYGDFKKRSDLYIDDNIEDELKNDVFKAVGVDCRVELFEKNIDAKALGREQTKTTTGVIATIRNRFDSVSAYQYSHPNPINGRYYKYPASVLLPIAKYIVGLLPANSECEVFQRQNEYRSVVDSLENNGLPYLGTVGYTDDNFWAQPNRIVAGDLHNIISNDKNIEGVNARLGGIGHKKVYEQLNAFYKISELLRIENKTIAIYPNQHDDFCALNSLSAESGEDDALIKDIAAKLPSGKDYREFLLSRFVVNKLERIITREQIIEFVDEKVHTLFETPSNWKNEDFKEAVTQFIEKWAKTNRVLFEEKCHYTKEEKDAITVNVIITPEIREQLQALVSSGTDIVAFQNAQENAKRVSELEAKVAELTALLDSRSGGASMEKYDGCNDDLSNEQKQAYLEEARDIILKDLKDEGYDIANYDWDWTRIWGVKDSEGKECPIIFRSNRSHRDTVITPTDWDILKQPNAMFGIVTSEGKVRKYKLNDLLKGSEFMTIRFATSNCDIPERLDKLSDIFRYFGGIQFNFEKYIEPTLLRWQSFMAPEKNTGETAVAGSVDLIPQ